MKLVKISYYDLAEKDNVDMNEAKSMTLKRMETFGYLLESNDIIRIIKEYDVDDDFSHQVIAIPRSLVKEIVYLKEFKKKR